MHDEDLSGQREQLIRLLAEAMLRHPAAGGVTVTSETRLLEVGVVDSTALLDVILEVETACGLSFDALRLDLEGGLTLGMLAEAFLPAEAEVEPG